MRHGKSITRTLEPAVFDRAVSSRAIAQITVQVDEGWRTFKCRFLERDQAKRYFVLDYESVNGAALPPLALGQYVGVSFRHTSHKIMFASVVEAKGKFVAADDRKVSAIRYRWPESVTELQRRSFYRTEVPEGMSLLAHVWPGGVARRAAAQGESLEVIGGELVDLSCGGTFVRLQHSGQLPWPENTTVGIEFQLGDGKPPILVDANARGCRTDENGNACVAVQFVGLEMSVDGRLVLQRLAQAVQRLHRASLSSNPRVQRDAPGQ